MYEESLEWIETFEQYVSEYEKGVRELKKIQADLLQITDLKNTLLEKYSKKFAVIQEAEVREYSAEEIEAIRAELLDNSILTVLKRFLGIGKKQDVIYAELMGKIKGLTLYLRSRLEQKAEETKSFREQLEQCGKKILENYRKVQNHIKDQFPSRENRFLYFGDTDILLEAERENSEPAVKEILEECYQNEFVKVPYTCSCEDPFLFYLEYEGEAGRKRANGLTRSLLYQMIAKTGEYELELHLIDGEDTGKEYSELLALKQIRENEVWELNTAVTGNVYKYAQLYLSNQDISDGLKNLDQYISRVAIETAGFENVQEYNGSSKAKDRGMIPMQMVVIQNFPAGFNESDIELLDKLIKNGGQRGIFIILQYDRKNKKFFEERVDIPTEHRMNGVILETQGEYLTAHDYSGAVDLKILPGGDRDFIQKIVDEKTKMKEVDNRFMSLMPAQGPFGMENATKGIVVPFALDHRGNICTFTLAQATNAHGLISGVAGSGKSTLLHMIISSVCMNYTPQDVELWLVDYKITEFSSYKYNTPPHIKFLGLSKGEDFTFAFLDKIYEEYERRQRLIKQADIEKKMHGESVNITSITDFREYYGKDSMSRLLIIIDEFHVMAQQVYERPEYRQKLENILAEGRAMGITMLLSDQAVTVGLKGLTEKGRKQIKCRLAMANDMEEMKEMLQTKEKEELKPFRNLKTGDCVLVTAANVRSENGEVEETLKMERVRNIYIDGETRFQLCKNIRRFYHAEDYTPVYMDETERKYYSDAEITQWNQNRNHSVNYTRQIPVYFGEALDLSGCFMIPVAHRRGDNLMCVGGVEEEQIQLILSTVFSWKRVPGHKIVLFADEYCQIFNLYEEEFRRLQSEDPEITVYSGIREICLGIRKLVEEGADRSRENRTLAIWLGLDELYDEFQRYPEKSYVQKQLHKNPKKESSVLSDQLEDKWALLFGDEKDETETEQNDEEFQEDELEEYNAIEDIVWLIQTGPRNGIFQMIVYDNTYPIRNNRKIKPEDFRHKLAFSMGRDECGEYLGRNMLLDGMENQKGVAAYYDGKGQVRKFLPYHFHEIESQSEF